MSHPGYSATRRAATSRSTSALLVAVALAGCGGGGGDNTTGPGTGPGTPLPLTITVSAATTTVPAAGTVILTATASGGAAGQTGAGVVWRTTGGTLAANGTTATLTAPAQGGPVTVTVLANADSTRRASAALTVTPVRVTIADPATTRLLRSVRLAEPLRAVVTGAAPGRDSVTWTTTCGSVVRRDAQSADYDAPATPGPCTVSARSTLDITASAERELVVRDAWLVTTREDDGNDLATCTNERCTLRAAIARAAGTPAPDTIVLGDARFGRALAGSILLTAPLPMIESAMHLEGPGAGTLTIDANASDAAPRNVFTVIGGGVLSVEHVTLRGGLSPVDGGGGISVMETAGLSLRDVVLRDNRAPGRSGGGLMIRSTGDVVLERVDVLGNTARSGGGVSVGNNSKIIITDSRIADNAVVGSASSAGGGLSAINADITLTDVIVENNRAASGGGLHVSTSPSVMKASLLTRVTVRNNVATSVGGGLRFEGGVGARLANLTVTGNRAAAAGGLDLIDATDVLLTDSRIAAQNDSTEEEGGLRVSNSSVIARDVVIEDNHVLGAVGGVSVVGQALVRFERVSIRRNHAGSIGGMIVAGPEASVTMTGGEISQNVSRVGTSGGVELVSGAALVLDNVTVAENTAGSVGGGIFQATGALTVLRSRFTNNRATGHGGAIYVAAQSTLTIDASTFAGNEAGLRGGALFTFAGTIRNSTFSANKAVDGGTAVVAMSGIALTNVTVADHQVVGAGNGTAVLFAAGTPSTVTNTLFARNRRGDNTTGNCSISGGSVTSGGHNLSDDATCVALTATGDRTNVSAGLADSLVDNGGPTLTYLPLTGSPAVNGGSGAACSAADQRGAPRVGACDIGATEFGATPPAAAGQIRTARH